MIPESELLAWNTNPYHTDGPYASYPSYCRPKPPFSFAEALQKAVDFIVPALLPLGAVVSGLWLLLLGARVVYRWVKDWIERRQDTLGYGLLDPEKELACSDFMTCLNMSICCGPLFGMIRFVCSVCVAAGAAVVDNVGTIVDCLSSLCKPKRARTVMIDESEIDIKIMGVHSPEKRSPEKRGFSHSPGSPELVAIKEVGFWERCLGEKTKRPRPVLQPPPPPPPPGQVSFKSHHSPTKFIQSPAIRLPPAPTPGRPTPGRGLLAPPGGSHLPPRPKSRCRHGYCTRVQLTAAQMLAHAEREVHMGAAAEVEEIAAMSRVNRDFDERYDLVDEHAIETGGVLPVLKEDEVAPDIPIAPAAAPEAAEATAPSADGAAPAAPAAPADGAAPAEEAAASVPDAAASASPPVESLPPISAGAPAVDAAAVGTPAAESNRTVARSVTRGLFSMIVPSARGVQQKGVDTERAMAQLQADAAERMARKAAATASPDANLASPGDSAPPPADAAAVPVAAAPVAAAPPAAGESPAPAATPAADPPAELAA